MSLSTSSSRPPSLLVLPLLPLLLPLFLLLLLLSSLPPPSHAQPTILQQGELLTLSQSTAAPTAHWSLAVDPSTQTSRASPSALHTFHWHLPRAAGSAEWLRAQFERVTDPTHPLYQRWMDKAQVMRVIAPPTSVVTPVLDWLAQYGVGDAASSAEGGGAQVRNHGDVLEVTASVSSVEAMFGVEMHHHTRVGSAASIVRAQGRAASIPAALAASLRPGGLQQVYDLPPPFIRHSIQAYPPPSSPPQSAADAAAATPPPQRSAAHSFHTLARGPKADCSRYPAGTQYAVPASFVRALYNFSASETTATAVNGQQVAAIGGSDIDSSPSGATVRILYSPADLTIAGQQYNYTLPPQLSPQPYAQQDALAYAAQGVPGLEGTLDIQALYAYAPDSYVANVVAAASDNPANFVFDVYYNIPAGQRPAVVSQSITYGQDFGLASVPEYTDATLQLLGLAGVTWLVSSGDFGAPGPNTACQSAPSSGGIRLSNTIGPLVPLYPATSPYVLAVGATDAYYQASTSNFQDLSSEGFCGACGTNSVATVACQSSSVGEEAATSFTSTTNPTFRAFFSSGGGFSDVEAQPTYQADFVSAYLNTNCVAANGCTLPPATYFNRSNRGYPDVAFLGVNFPLITAGSVQLGISGTSLSTPGWAAIIARLNTISVSITGKTLGFINPLLYYFQRQYLANPSTLNPFNDITVGNNVCPSYNGGCISATNFGRCSGFDAAPGWDPVTGLGTPNVGHLESLLTAYLTSTGASGLFNPPVPMQESGGALVELTPSLNVTSVGRLSGFLSTSLFFSPSFPYTVYGLRVGLNTSLMAAGTTANVQLALYAVTLNNFSAVVFSLVDYTANVVVPAGFSGFLNASTVSTSKPALTFNTYAVALRTDNPSLQGLAVATGLNSAVSLASTYVVGAPAPAQLIFPLVLAPFALEATVLISPFSGAAAAILGDPSFVGFLGQEYQVHGIDGMVYNLISSRSLQLNALFVFHSAGRCPYTDQPRLNSNCWSHPGSYLGSIALQLRVEGVVHQLRVDSGDADAGFARVALDGTEVVVGDSAEVADEDGSVQLSVRRSHSHELLVGTGPFSFTLHNSDRFINQAIRINLPVRTLKAQGVHGLIGQTHTRKHHKGRTIPHIDGEVEDYNVRDGLTGTDFVYDQFRVQAE